MLHIINDSGVSVINSKFVTIESGGTATFIVGFLNFLTKKKICFNLVGNFQNAIHRDFSCYKINSQSNAAFLFKLLWYLITKRYFFKKNIYYCHRPDHMALCLLRNGRHILHLHGQPHKTINQSRSIWYKVIYNFLERIAIRNVDYIIATDWDTVAFYSGLYPSLEKQFYVVPTGINLEDYNFQENITLFPGIIHGTQNFAFIGRLAYPKQIKKIIKAFESAFHDNTNVHLWIAGNGPDDISLKSFASKCSNSYNIHFTGLLTKSQVKQLIHSTISGVLLSHNEGSPIVVKEFLASGKPIIANLVGDLRQYLINDVNSFIVNDDDHEQIVMAFNSALVKAPSMMSACIESMQCYGEERIYPYTLSLLLQE